MNRLSYSRRWHEYVDEGARRSAKVVVPLIVDLINPQSVVDVGCGFGAWLSTFRDYGVEDLLGLDGAHIDAESLTIVPEQFLACDLADPPAIDRRFDLVICLEVAEHLPELLSEDFVAFLTDLGPIVLFSAAIPFQGGEHHINEQWPEYWAERFERRGYVVVDSIRSSVWQDPDVEWWYAQNILLFVDEDEIAGRPRLRTMSLQTKRSQLAMIHPRRFLEEHAHQSADIWVGDLAEDLIERVKPFTMLSEDALRELALQVKAVEAFDVAGAVVECGVWKGGAAFLAAELVRDASDDRKVWLFDSFESLPSPHEIGGAAAEEVRRNAVTLGVEPYVEIVEGPFDRTLALNGSRIGSVALLRLDCECYESTKTCLTELYDLVAPGGLVAIDDYYTHDGCSRAVHEFLARRRLSHRIEPIAGQKSRPVANYDGAIFRKGGATWNLLRWMLPVRSDIVKIVPAGSSFVIVDQDAFADEIAAGRKMSRYPYPPADDREAIGILERLMDESSPSFLLFAWPAFWWLDYFTGFREHLESSFPRVLSSERVVAFDLRAP